MSDADGHVRERLSWPLHLPDVADWRVLPCGHSEALVAGGPHPDRIVALRFTGRAAPAGDGSAQTLLSAFRPGIPARLSIGLRGVGQRLTVIVGPETGRSPHYWHGPAVAAAAPFDIRLVIHPGMGPGGFIHDVVGDGRWSSLAAASPWGAERLNWPERWSVGHAQRGAGDQPFRGSALVVSASVD